MTTKKTKISKDSNIKEKTDSNKKNETKITKVCAKPYTTQKKVEAPKRLQTAEGWKRANMKKHKPMMDL